MTNAGDDDREVSEGEAGTTSRPEQTPVEGSKPEEPPVTVDTTRKSADERKQLLAQQIRTRVTQGARVESQSDFEAVLAIGQPVNHTLHAILTIVTCLLWGIVWAVITATGGVKRELVSVDEFGNVLLQKIETR